MMTRGPGRLQSSRPFSFFGVRLFSRRFVLIVFVDKPEKTKRRKSVALQKRQSRRAGSFTAGAAGRAFADLLDQGLRPRIIRVQVQRLPQMDQSLGVAAVGSSSSPS